MRNTKINKEKLNIENTLEKHYQNKKARYCGNITKLKELMKLMKVVSNGPPRNTQKKFIKVFKNGNGEELE